MTHKIKIIAARNYLATLGIASDGITAHTHLASLRWEDNKIDKFYIKIYPQNIPLGLINEITGYLLADSSDLPQPPKAGLIQIPKKVLIDNFQLQFQLDDSLDFVWGWATQAYGNKTPNTFFHIGDMFRFNRCLEDLKNWPKIADLVSLDDWMANQDRNTGNITILAKNEFGIIDHGNIPVSSNWKESDLDPNKDFNNILLELLWSNNPPLPLSHRMVEQGKKHKNSYSNISEELKYWWGLFLDNKKENAINDFLSKRSLNSANRIKDRVGLLVA